MPACRCIVPHPLERARLLLVRQSGGWVLPEMEIPARWFPRLVAQLTRALSTRLGFEIRVLRHMREGGLDYCEVETHEVPKALPGHGRWVGAEELAALTDAGDRAVVERWLRETELEAPPALRQPWERRGWLAGASAWIRDQVGPAQIDQVKGAWGCSAILRVRTRDALYFFKAGYAKPPAEPAVILALAERWADHLPAVAAADVDRGWLLMRDFGAVDLDVRRPALCHEAVRLFARMQIDVGAERWQALGCPDFRPEALPGRLRRMAELGPIELRLPQVEDLCARLAELGPAPSLVQQDFRPGNVATTPSRIIFYDWSDAVVGHPFFSLVNFLDDIPAADQPALIDAYLEPWAALHPADRLREALAVARQLAAVYQAVRWHHELDFLEPGTPWALSVASGLPDCLKRI